MIVVPDTAELIAEASGLVLARYARIIQYPECAFWGVAREGDQRLECRTRWTKLERDKVARSLAEAQIEIEQEIGYFLSPRFVVGQSSGAENSWDWLVDSQKANRSLRFSTRWARLIGAGVKKIDTIQAGAAVSHVADPAVIGPIASTLTDPDEIYIYHPGTDVPITPSKITLTGAALSIEIPRCRMVTADAYTEFETGVPYDDTANFEQTVDIKRISLDPSTNATLVWPHACNSVCSSCGCSEFSQTACIYIRNDVRGWVDLRPANFTDSQWIGASACRRGCPQVVRLNYLSGVKHLTPQSEDVILRLAHSKMPKEPCGCDMTQLIWARDRNIPQVLTRERINCPFGLSDGAWTAYQFTRSLLRDTEMGVI